MGNLSVIYAKLHELCCDLALQSKLAFYITEENCEQWNKAFINDERLEYCEKESQHRFLRKPCLVQSQFYMTSIHYFVLRFASLLEWYLKRSLVQAMKLNDDLLEKGVEKISSLPKEINGGKPYSAALYIETLNVISCFFTSGELWTKKFNKYIGLIFDDSKILTDFTSVNKELDELFSLRNDIAHLNTYYASLSKDSLPEKLPKIVTKEGVVFHREAQVNVENYKIIIVHLIELMQKVLELLTETDQAINEKYPPNLAKPEEKYKLIIKSLSD